MDWPFGPLIRKGAFSHCLLLVAHWEFSLMSDNTAVSDTPQSSMGKLLEEHGMAAVPKVGDVIKGTVLSVTRHEVHLDIEGITTGVIRGRELFDESGEFSNLKIGEEAQATVLELENESGEMELSFRQAGHRKAWEELVRFWKGGDVVDALIVDANRGGLMVRVGRVMGFLPVSQLMTEHYPRVEGGDKNKILEILATFVGQNFRVKLIDVNEQEDKLIVSEKAAMEEKQKELISQFSVDTVVDGTVTGVVDFGVFVEFGPRLEGLVHISELAWQRVDNPRDLYHVGDTMKAKIIGIEGTKISLSVKRLTEDPWKTAVERYAIGQVVKGQVLKINPFGAFVELDKEIHGLAHVSELSDKPIRDPGSVLKAGERYDFKIISIDAKSHRLGLSRKALTREPAAAETAEPAASGEEPKMEAPTEPAAEPTPEAAVETPAEES